MSVSSDIDDIDDINAKVNDSREEENYSDTEKLKEKKSAQNSEKNQSKKENIGEDKKEEKQVKKERESSDEDSDSSDKSKNEKEKGKENEEEGEEDEEEKKKEKEKDKEKDKESEKEKEKIKEKEDKKEIVKEDSKEKNNKNNKNDDDSDSSDSEEERKKRMEQQRIRDEMKAKKAKEKEEDNRKALKEKEKKEKEMEEKKKKMEENKKEFIGVNINKNVNPSWQRKEDNYPKNNNNFFHENIQMSKPQNSYVKRKGKKYDLNDEKNLRNIISENIEIIDEMKNAYPGIPKLDCAYILKKLKGDTSAYTLFEIMNKIHRDISTELTLNRANKSEKEFLSQIEPYEIIDSIYNNPEHVTTMKFYKIYSHEDKDRLPQYLQESLPNNFYYNKNREKEERRRKLIKFIDGSFNYIPVLCPNIKTCRENNCPYSHNENESDYHPLYYKTSLENISIRPNDTKLIKNACDLFNDFRIIYNYKDENIIKLMKLFEEKNYSKYSFSEYMKNKISSFSLNTFKTLECPSIKSGLKCPKEDPHLCYYYHDVSERRRPPTLFRYINEMCSKHKIKNGKIKEKCPNEDFCTKCHSKYEYYYHSLFYGKAMTCKRPRKFGKCIFEETCYAYHPYKEPGYKRTKEEILKEKKDEIMEKYSNEADTLSKLIKKYRCPNCEKFKGKLKYHLLLNCGHIICSSCFEKSKKCPKCNQKIIKEKEGEDYIPMDFSSTSVDIDKLMKEN